MGVARGHWGPDFGSDFKGAPKATVSCLRHPLCDAPVSWSLAQFYPEAFFQPSVLDAKLLPARTLGFNKETSSQLAYDENAFCFLIFKVTSNKISGGVPSQGTSPPEGKYL